MPTVVQTAAEPVTHSEATSAVVACPGTPPTTISGRNDGNERLESPARTTAASSGRKGTSRTAKSPHPPPPSLPAYRRKTSRPTSHSTSGSPHLRTARKARADPTTEPARLRAIPSQTPKTSEPTRETGADGIGATNTWATIAKK